MDTTPIKKKAWYLGTWRQNVLADNVIYQIQQLVARKKGTPVKLCFAKDGIRVLTSNFLQGKVFQDHIPFSDLYFMTVNQHNPHCLLVIAKDLQHKYRIIAYRCENALDAGIIIQQYRDIRKSMTSVEGYNIELRRSNEGNWTLRTKQQEEDKRQLRTIVDMHADSPTRQQNGVVKTLEIKPTVVNGHSKTDENRNSKMVIQAPSSPREKVTLEKVYRKGKTMNNIGIQANGQRTERVTDDVSETSTSESNQSFQNELNYLSNELRDIKFMLEKSTGISAEVYHDKNGIEIQTESPPTERETDIRINQALEPIDAIIQDEDETDNTPKQIHTDEIGANVRVSVPDYRSLGVQASSKTVSTAAPEKRAATLPAYFRQTQPDGPERLRASTSTYQSWKDDVVLRGGVGPRSARPRTAVYSTSSYGSTSSSVQGSLRGVPNGAHVHFDPAAPKGSIVYRKKGISTNVQKPIEKVYQRPHSVHSSSRPYVVHHHHHHGAPVHRAPANLDFNQSNGVVVTNGYSPSSPRSPNGAGFFIRS